MGRRIDHIDLTLIGLLQESGRTTASALAEIVGRSVPAISARMRRLESLGVVRGYEAVLEPRRLGFRAAAFLRVLLASGTDREQFVGSASMLSGVLEVHELADAATFVLKVRAQREEDLEHVRRAVSSWPGIEDVELLPIRRTHHESRALPIETSGNGSSASNALQGVDTKNS